MGSGLNSMTVTVDTGNLDKLLDQLGDAADNAVRPAAQAGAQIIYEAVLRQVPKGRKGHWFHGTQFRVSGKKYWFDAGTLRRSIYQVYSKDNSGPSRATYHVSWNHTECPYGYMVEYGTSRAPAAGFMRAAQAASFKTAGDAMEQALVDRLLAKASFR